MTPRENELSQQLFGGQQQSITAMGAIKEALQEFRDQMYPGLTWDKMTSEIGQELKHMGNLGRTELASALFGNGAFVLYSHEPKNEQGKDGPEQAQDDHTPQQDTPSQHLERGSRNL